MTKVRYAKRVARMPGYKAGVPKGTAPEQIAAGNLAQLASNESPLAPHPAVIEAMQRTAAAMNRYPDPDATLLRTRIAERYDLDPARVAVGNGSCEILLAAAQALLEPGDEIVYAWPSFSIYPHLAATTGATEIRVPLDGEDRHDLEAMLEEITVATQIVLVCNPNNPTGTVVPFEEIARFIERVPGHVTVIIDEAYVEFLQSDDPDSTLDLLPRYPNLILLRTFSKCYGLAGVRVGYALGSVGFRSAVDAVRQPFDVNAIAQAAGAEAILHSDDVANNVENAITQRVVVEEGLHAIGLETAETEANFSWVRLGDADEAEIVAGLAESGIAVRPGTPLGGPGHIRVNYGTPAENERFLSALAGLVA